MNARKLAAVPALVADAIVGWTCTLGAVALCVSVAMGWL